MARQFRYFPGVLAIFLSALSIFSRIKLFSGALWSPLHTKQPYQLCV
ncbi:hypothetical protein [Pasteurella langaaensis]|nr:hypothetical protein [Pasteurella langaaensis]